MSTGSSAKHFENYAGFHIDAIWLGLSAPSAPDFCGRKIYIKKRKKRKQKGGKREKKEKKGAKKEIGVGNCKI